MKVLSVPEALEALAAGEIVAVPTDTVYGLAAAPSYADRIAAVKGRDPTNTIPILCLAAHIDRVTTADLSALDGTLWPGPLTVAVPAAVGVHGVLVARDGTVGVRVPSHPLLAEILEAAGPLAVSSANRAGEPPATDAATACLPGVAGVVDAGPSPGGMASTVVRWADGAILRAGPITGAEIEAIRTR